MHSSARRLRGTQLSVIVAVPTYEIENPPRPGEDIATDAGTATVTRTELVGAETIWWADYGSGIEHPHQAEGIKRQVPREAIAYIAPSGIATTTGTMLNPTYFEPETSPAHSKRERRHSPKGKASGSIKERVGNKKRKHPTTSYFYEWYEGGEKKQLYIPTKYVQNVHDLIDRKCSVKAVLDLLRLTKPSKQRANT